MIKHIVFWRLKKRDHDQTREEVVLYSEFESRGALAGYHNHPAHQEIVKFVGERRTERRIADYEV